MDVLSPELIWIGQRCYRVNIPREGQKSEARVRVNYEEEEGCEFDIGEDDFYEIETVDGGRKFQLKVHVPQVFHSMIIGAKGNTRRRLEQETLTSIQVPKVGSKDTNVVVKGNSKRDVMLAKNRIDLIMIGGRSKQQFTHFVSVSFATEEIKSNFQRFKEDIINDSDIYGIDESLFQKPEKLHSTVVMLVLMDNQDRTIAAEYLQDCKEMIIDPILQGGELKVKLAGINYMNDDPCAVNVLYAEVVSEELQKIADQVAQYFADRGLIQLRNESVKLHVTLLNSRFSDSDDATEKDESSNSRSGKRKTFDASKILKKYKDFYFGSVTVNEIHLSQLFSKASNGYYESTGILSL